VNITKIVTVRMTHGGDTTYLHTDLPDGIWPYEGTATLSLFLARGFAEQYVDANFPGIPHEVIEV
jgi:hypothetical protein